MIPEYIIRAALEYKSKHGNSKAVYDAFIEGYKATKRTKASNVKLSEYQEKEFEEAWILYGRKGSKGDAKKVWAKIPEEDYPSVKHHIRVYTASRDMSYQKDFERYLRNKTYESVIVKGNEVVYAPSERNNSSLSERFIDWVAKYYPNLRDMDMPDDVQLRHMLEICDNKIEACLDQLCDDHHTGSLYDLFKERFGGN